MPTSSSGLGASWPSFPLTSSQSAIASCIRSSNWSIEFAIRLILHRLPRGRIDAAEDVDESVARLLRQRRAGERCEVGVEVVGVARAGEDDVDARFVAAEAVGGIR